MLKICWDEVRLCWIFVKSNQLVFLHPTFREACFAAKRFHPKTRCSWGQKQTNYLRNRCVSILANKGPRLWQQKAFRTQKCFVAAAQIVWLGHVRSEVQRPKFNWIHIPPSDLILITYHTKPVYTLTDNGQLACYVAAAATDIPDKEIVVKLTLDTWWI